MFHDEGLISKATDGTNPTAASYSARPFYNCGVEYAGPFLIHQGSPRSKKQVKCYAALFVCLATRVLHIELVSDLITSVFLAAFRRFISRRGKCQNIFSDNATNFKGVSQALNELQDLFQGKGFADTVSGFLSREGIQWHFIPPDSSHFGGWWEAGVKSMRHHMQRVIANQAYL
jgi:hypothetical protein